MTEVVIMKERKSFITENTKIILDEDVFKIKAQRLFWKQMVEYANNKYKAPVLKLK